MQRHRVMARCMKSRQTPAPSRKASRASAIHPRLEIIESQMPVHEIADGLDSRPTRGRPSKSVPGQIVQFAIHFAISGCQQELQRSSGKSCTSCFGASQACSSGRP